MAKTKLPLYSIRASGKLGGGLRYAHRRGRDIALSNRTGRATQGLAQRRQSNIVSEAARMWRNKAQPDSATTYRDFVASVSAQNWYFTTGAILLEWNDSMLMPAN